MLQNPTGTFDIFGDEQKYWRKIEQTFDVIVSSFGFDKIETPIFEYKSIFEKGIGATTDIIEKQMFFLKKTDESESDLALRPEHTAPLVRAYIQHGMHTLPQPVKLYYLGPVFRHERPQKGRFRQHHQLGIEIFGVSSPYTDAFLIGLMRTFYSQIGLKNLIYEVNSIGCRNCRVKIKKALVEYFKTYLDSVCAACQNRFLKNPLRILDCKEEKCQAVIAGAPALIDYLCSSCREHFRNMLEYLESLEVPYDFNPRLVRGLDYYTQTVFEIIPGDNGPSLGGGGRYDDLIELFGGVSTPAIGFAGGIERTVMEMKKQSLEVTPLLKPEIFLIQLGDLAKEKSLPILFKLHQAGFRVTLALDKDSLKSQLRVADKQKIPIALILGQREARDGTMIVRNMLDGSQETIDLKKLTEFLKKRIGGAIRIKKHE